MHMFVACNIKYESGMTNKPHDNIIVQWHCILPFTERERETEREKTRLNPSSHFSWKNYQKEKIRVI